MALTGLGLVGFVIAHMLGNLQVFMGREKLNHYAQSLQDLGAVLWAMRIGLLTLFVVHVATAFKLAQANKAARPVAYVSAKPQVTSYAARTMLMSGLIILAFVAYHLAHFTFGWTNPEHFKLHETIAPIFDVPSMGGSRAEVVRHDVYGMVVAGFQIPLVAGLYVVAQALLCLHISHGASSAFQTLGVTHPAFAWLKTCFGKALAVVIFVGNCSIPLAVLAGWVK
jgi:succinate dehydrogenase / fumarate reductase cytochrome b subunit